MSQSGTPKRSVPHRVPLRRRDELPATEFRVATQNLLGEMDGWADRRKVLRAGLAQLDADLVSLQECVVRDGYDQARDLLGDGYHIVHQTDREPDGRGATLASRWPIVRVREIDMHVTERTEGFASGALIAEIAAPAPLGTVILVNHVANWQLTFEYERELQTVIMAREVEHQAAGRDVHVIVAGDHDARIEAASTRFLLGLQSLGNMSVCYRDSWRSAHPGVESHTFTPDNRLVIDAADGMFETELGREIDQILVRCRAIGPTLRTVACERTHDLAPDGVWASDHYGVAADLSTVTVEGRPILRDPSTAWPRIDGRAFRV
jgi:endonuclease/exonuclease/phosphatase family metal-dependent hydrolase